MDGSGGGRVVGVDGLEDLVWGGEEDCMFFYKGLFAILRTIIQFILQLSKRHPETIIQLLLLFLAPLTQLALVKLYQGGKTSIEEFVSTVLVAGLLGHHGLEEIGCRARVCKEVDSAALRRVTIRLLGLECARHV